MRAFLLLCGVSACTAEDKPPLEDSGVEALGWAVDEPGPFGVGYRTWEVTYEPAEGFPERTIRLNLWYPTEDTDGDAAQYTFGGPDDAVIENATLAPSAHRGSHPVHVHSHGYRGYGASSVFLARYFATHGWMTLAPDHTNNTFLDHEDPLPSAHYFHRPLDVRAALDAMVNDTVGSAGDTDAVLLSGHSFGAYTTWAAGGATYDLDNVAHMCATGEGIHDDGCTEAEEAMFATDLSDPRVVATLPMAGTYRDSWFGEDGYRSIQAPVLFMGGTEDDVGQQDQWDALEHIDFTWVEITGGCHQTFALGACSTLDPELGFHIVQTYALSVARAHVLEDDSEDVQSILSGDLSVSEEVIIQHRQSG